MKVTLKLAWTGYRYTLYNEMYSFKSSTVEDRDEFVKRIADKFSKMNVVLSIDVQCT